MAPASRRPAHRPKLHLLLEVWLEPREILGAPRLVRARVRNLLTGRRRLLKSPTELSHFVEAELDALDPAPRVWEGQ
jgi:hypothetical protein